MKTNLTIHKSTLKQSMSLSIVFLNYHIYIIFVNINFFKYLINFIDF